MKVARRLGLLERGLEVTNCDRSLPLFPAFCYLECADLAALVRHAFPDPLQLSLLSGFEVFIYHAPL